jgi:CheY-like chemotaxis protein/tRNA A-37 threonylcarbamoyl transferase component Bud32
MGTTTEQSGIDPGDQRTIGNYDVLAKLGAGGMGTVFKARHRRMKRIVALKLLPKTHVKNPQFLQRFQREVEVISRLSHPNIVMAYDADEDEAGPFLAMEFVDGCDLDSLVARQGRLGLVDAVNCVIQAARGLAYAHAQGIIHRDIKPANLLRDKDGVIKVTDLGIARLNDPEGKGGLTQTGYVLGTVDFMAPEQALDSTKVDGRADIYSLGATLYFLLIGDAPYPAPTLMAALLKHREAPIPSLRAERAEVPPELDTIFRRMMAKAPADRFPTMMDVVAALETFAATKPAAGLSTEDAAPRETMAGGPSVADENFGFTLATPASAMAGTIDAKPIGSTLAGTTSVLLVEPSRTQAAIIRKLLEGQGIQRIVTAATGREAIRIVIEEPPDAIVAAQHLSDMNGLELAERIRKETRAASTGFVLISTEAEAAQAGSLSKLGKAVRLHKPFTSEQLMDALRGVCAVSSPGAESVRSKLRVLIVDDSTVARVHIRNVLQTLGLTQFKEAVDGAQAVAAVATEKFDLIVTDYNMPLMDGRGFIGYLKLNPATASIPIIMVTTEDDPAKLEEIRRLGVSAICDKSFPADVVRSVVDQLVNKP